MLEHEDYEIIRPYMDLSPNSRYYFWLNIHIFVKPICTITVKKGEECGTCYLFSDCLAGYGRFLFLEKETSEQYKYHFSTFLLRVSNSFYTYIFSEIKPPLRRLFEG
jgi:hypothetical protein